MALEKKQKLMLVAGIGLGLIAIAMTKVYLDQQQQALRAQAKRELASIRANQSAVLVAKKDIARGAVIEASMLDTAVVPNKFVQPQAVSSLDRIAGMVVVTPISKGEQISLSKLTTTAQASGGDLAGITPAGKRAIAIVVDNIASLSGMIKPGDYVDVIAMLQVPTQGPEGQQSNQVAVIPLFQNVLVLAVGRNTGAISAPRTSRYMDQGDSSSGQPLITLALAPQEANLIAFVQEQGKIRLTLRSPADAKVEPMAPASWETLFQYIMPQKSAEPETKEPSEDTDYVEVYRGLNREKVPLSK